MFGALVVTLGLGACLAPEVAFAPSAAAGQMATRAADPETPRAADPTPTTAPSGPSIHKQQQEADNRQASHKLIIGVIAVGLLAIVFFGRRSRRKYLKKLKNLQNAKV